MATFSFDINCIGVNISPNGNRSVTVSLEDVDKSDVFDIFELEEFISHYGIKKILDEIDETDVRKHFNIPDEEEK